MQQDYKFLTGPSSKPPRIPLPTGRHHLAWLGIVVLGLFIIIISIPEHADAKRAEMAVTPAADSMNTHEVSVITHELALPPLPHPEEETQNVPEPSAEQDHWLTARIKSGESMAHIFSRLKLSATQLHQIVHTDDNTRELRRVHPGDEIRVRVNDDQQIQELLYRIDESQQLQVLKSAQGFQSTILNEPLETRIAHASGTIDHSLFLAGQDAGLSDNMTMQLANIFGWDIDFALDIRQGDHFTVIYEEIYKDGKKIRDGDILAAEFYNHGHVYQAIRYTAGDGTSNYFAPDGMSMRKAFLRTPVAFSRISSRFSLGRKHPILNRIRAHKGVDYAAPTGTPIKATGDGKIVFRGKKNGYGNTLIIQHGNKYSTLYAHMSRFNGKARVGKRVQQGQVIGYVGMTGLATGPHLHYEFRINGVHRNPLTVRLPEASPIERKYLRDFKEIATQRLAQLELIQHNMLALQQQ